MTLALLVAAWLGGVLLGLETDVRLAAVFLLLGAAVCLGLALHVAQWPLLPAVLAALLLIGVWRTESTQAELDPLTTQFEQMVSVQGVVADDPEARGQRTRFELSVISINRGDGPEQVEGRLLVYAEPSAELAARRGPPTSGIETSFRQPECCRGLCHSTDSITRRFWPPKE